MLTNQGTCFLPTWLTRLSTENLVILNRRCFNLSHTYVLFLACGCCYPLQQWFIMMESDVTISLLQLQPQMQCHLFSHSILIFVFVLGICRKPFSKTFRDYYIALFSSTSKMVVLCPKWVILYISILHKGYRSYLSVFVYRLFPEDFSPIVGTNHTINRAAFVCLSVCLFVPYLLRGPLTDLRQTWWVYVGGPRNCPWGVLFRKGQRLDGSTGHFHFPLYYICASLTPHSCKRRLCCYCN